MKAAWYERKGPAREVIQYGDMDEPRPGPGEVLVKIRVSGVNPSDYKRRVGFGATSQAMEFPRVIPNNDGAGVIEAVGEGVDPSRKGERVWLYEAQIGRPFGTAAEYCVVPAVNAVPLPDSTSFEEGACLGVPAMTAHYLVFCDGPVEGKNILVAGGAGAVGHYAIQFAKWGGAGVVATVSSPDKAEIAAKAGADQVVDYKREDIVERINCLTAGKGVDRVIEVAFGHNIDADATLLSPHGVIATYASDDNLTPALPFYRLVQKNALVRFAFLYGIGEQAHRAAVAGITTCLKENKLSHLIGPRFPLQETAAAHEAVEHGGKIGQVLIDVA